jgi:GNAT superfamily N-acetyltransferase
MVTVDQIDTRSRAQVRRFVRLPFRIYAHDPQWVPPILIEHEEQLDRKRHPFYGHSEADFFVAVRDGQDVGRIAALENRRFNQHHAVRTAQFYYFESTDDQEVAGALFERVFEWAHSRGLDTLIGPKGFGPLDGFGVLIDGFEGRQMTTMMNYNPPYYPRLIEELGFTKEVDFVSCFADSEGFHFPDRLYRIAERVQQRGTLRVQRFRTIRELKSWAPRIGEAYNKTFVHNWEYYPLTDREIAYVVAKLETIADPRLIKIIVHHDDVVGFLLAFPDISAAVRRSRGRLFPLGLIDILIEMRRTKWIAINAAGILPEFQGRGGNALLYAEIEKTVHEHKFEHIALYQVAETAVQMRRDLERLGGIAYKNHRVYRRPL